MTIRERAEKLYKEICVGFGLIRPSIDEIEEEIREAVLQAFEEEKAEKFKNRGQSQLVSDQQWDDSKFLRDTI